MKFLLLFILFFSTKAMAQLDPSASRLLSQGATDQSLDSSRYQVRPRTQAEDKRIRRALPTPTPTPTPVPPPPSPPKEEVKVEKKKETPVPVKVVLADEEEETRIHVEDPRLNIVKIKLAPGVLYIDSKSQSWYRSYYSFSPSLQIETDVWVTAKVGIRANYRTSLAADITTSPTSNAKTPTEHRNFAAGILFRHFASASRKSPSYIFGIGFEDYQMVIPHTEANRIRLNTNGLKISLAARLPTGLRTANLFSIDLLPKLDTDEEATQVTFRSGQLDSAHGVQLSIGREYIIDRKQQFYWKLSHRVDKHVYEGASSANDPITGTTLSGVSVTTGMTQFQFGFSWGD